MARTTLPPQYWLTLIAAFGLLAALGATAITLQIQVPTTQITNLAGQLVINGTPVRSFEDGLGSSIPAAPNLLMEEPDMLPDWAAFNGFMAQQDTLARAMAQQRLSATLADGTSVPLNAATRRLSELPGAYWMQLVFGLSGLILGASIWAFKPNDTASRLYAITGTGFAGAALTAAVYSTRELAMAPEIFRTLSVANHFSTTLFVTALLSLLWHYPSRLSRFPIVPVVFALGLLMWLADSLQLASKAWVGMQIIVLVFFTPCFVVAAVQWRRHRKFAIERAALTWFLLSVFSGTLLFFALVLAPPLFGAPPVAEQSLMFGVFLFVYVGIAAALTRYRLFDIERWWFSAWLWFLAGLAIVIMDALLLIALPIAGDTAALFAVAIIGWLYFPARQWLWRRLLPDPRERTATLLRSFVKKLAGVERVDAMPTLWRELLREAYDPLSIEALATSPSAPMLSQEGLALDFPATPHLPSLRLLHARRGMSLFSREDRELAIALSSLAAHSAEAIENRQRGIEEERQRIMRDLHDDLGSKLLAMTHTGDSSMQQLARSAFQDLRDVLRALDAGPTTLGQLLDHCRFELQSRAETHHFEMLFEPGQTARATVVTAREAANIARLLRESVTNAIRHAEAQQIQVNWSQQQTHLTVQIRHDGHTTNPEAWVAGRGVRTQRARAADLGGTIEWTINEADGRCETLMSLRLQAAA